MAMRNDEFSVGSWYHCFNTTIENRTAFEDAKDYLRFLEILYLANSTKPVKRARLGDKRFQEILRVPRDGQHVSIGAFSILPDHFHLVLREDSPGSITTFMRKIGTAYVMYFNARYKRSGNLFLRPFRSREVPETHVERLISYVHCSPASLYEPGWKTRHVVDSQFLEERLAAYPYSSFRAYMSTDTPSGAILDTDALSKRRVVPIERMLKEAVAYCADTDIP